MQCRSRGWCPTSRRHDATNPWTRNRSRNTAERRWASLGPWSPFSDCHGATCENVTSISLRRRSHSDNGTTSTATTHPCLEKCRRSASERETPLHLPLQSHAKRLIPIVPPIPKRQFLPCLPGSVDRRHDGHVADRGRKIGATGAERSKTEQDCRVAGRDGDPSSLGQETRPGIPPTTIERTSWWS